MPSFEREAASTCRRIVNGSGAWSCMPLRQRTAAEVAETMRLMRRPRR